MFRVEVEGVEEEEERDVHRLDRDWGELLGEPQLALGFRRWAAASCSVRRDAHESAERRAAATEVIEERKETWTEKREE